MKVMMLLGALCLIVTLIAVGPLITIWSLNTLFGLGIAYTFWTWLATLWLVGITVGRGSTKT